MQSAVKQLYTNQCQEGDDNESEDTQVEKRSNRLGQSLQNELDTYNELTDEGQMPQNKLTPNNTLYMHACVLVPALNHNTCYSLVDVILSNTVVQAVV